MSREAHVRIWERVGVRFPCATRHIITDTNGLLLCANHPASAPAAKYPQARMGEPCQCNPAFYFRQMSLNPGRVQRRPIAAPSGIQRPFSHRLCLLPQQRK